MGTQVPTFDEIDQFILDLKFKRTPFGANEEDVFACLEDLNAMYKDKMADAQGRFERAAGQLKKETEISRSQLREKEEALAKISEQYRQAVEEREEKNRQLERSRKELNEIRARQNLQQQELEKKKEQLRQLRRQLEQAQSGRRADERSHMAPETASGPVTEKRAEPPAVPAEETDLERQVEQRVEMLRESTIRAARREAMQEIDRALQVYTTQARDRARQEADELQAQALEKARKESDALRQQVLEDAWKEADGLKEQARQMTAELEKKQQETLAQMEQEASRQRAELIRKTQDEVERQRQEIMVRAKTEAELYRQEALEKAQREVEAIQTATERKLKQLQMRYRASKRSSNSDYIMQNQQNEGIFDAENSSFLPSGQDPEQDSAELNQMLQQAKDLKELHEILERIAQK